MPNDDAPQTAIGRDVDKVRAELRRHKETLDERQRDHECRAWSVLLGAVGIAQWVLLALPWFTIDSDEVIGGSVSGWGLLLEGVSGLSDGEGGEEKVLAFVIGIMPPAACLIATAVIWMCVLRPTRRRAGAVQFASVVAGLGFVGLYVTVGALSEDESSFAAPMFAALTLWFLAAALAQRISEHHQRLISGDPA